VERIENNMKGQNNTAGDRSTSRQWPAQVRIGKWVSAKQGSRVGSNQRSITPPPSPDMVTMKANQVTKWINVKNN